MPRTKPVASPDEETEYIPKEVNKRKYQRSSGNSGGFWIFVVLIAVLLAVMGFLAYNKYINENDADGTVLPAQIPLETANTQASEDKAAATSTDPTAGWLVYAYPSSTSATSTASSTFQFSFKYPEGLKLKQSANSVIITDDKATSTKLVVSWEKYSKPLAEYIKNADKVAATAFEGKQAIKVATSTDKVMIAGFPSIVREQTLLAAGRDEYVAYFKDTKANIVYKAEIISDKVNTNILSFFAVFLNGFTAQ